MTEISHIYDNLISSYGAGVVALCAVTLTLFFIQLYYYVALYGRIPSFRLNTKDGKLSEINPEVSVVVVVNEDECFIDNLLPAILTQDYQHYELIIVDLETNDEFSQSLQLIAEHNDKVKISTVHQKNSKFKVSNKMAINIGIKAASYDNIIITTVDSIPTSNKWLKIMAKGFVKADIVIGYCGMEKTKGLTNKWMRCDKLFLSVQHIASAIAGRVYRADTRNMGFTKKAYFEAKGFNFLTFNLGEDDLFIQKLIRKKYKATLILNPHASVSQRQWGKLSWWRANRKFNSYSFKFYPQRAKNYVQWELGSRILFFFSCLTLLLCSPLYTKIFALSLFILRLLIVWFEFRRIRKRLGERSLGWIYFFYDLFSAFREIRLWLQRTLKPSQGLWRH